jgi:membrane protease YdiL (CAAX protease family)
VTFPRHRCLPGGLLVVALPRPSAAREAPIVLALTALLTIVSVLPPGSTVAVAGLAALVLTVVAWARRAPAASSLGLLLVICLVLALAGLGPQQVVFAVAFAVYAIVVSRVPWLRGAIRWLAVGSVDRGTMALGVAFAGISGVALLGWYGIVRPDLEDLVRTFIPGWPLWLLVPAAIVFSLVNAAVEEAAYRGVVLDALDSTLDARGTVLVLQAVAFASLHFQAGFPRGVIGVALAFVYGVVLGALRQRAGGLMAPFITHVVTDLVIVTIVLALVRT